MLYEGQPAAWASGGKVPASSAYDGMCHGTSCRHIRLVFLTIIFKADLF
jgi:hypothetical protein